MYACMYTQVRIYVYIHTHIMNATWPVHPTSPLDRLAEDHEPVSGELQRNGLKQPAVEGLQANLLGGSRRFRIGMNRGY